MEKVIEIVKIQQVIDEVDVSIANINGPVVAAEIACQFIGDDDREVFLVMCLNVKNQVVAVHRASIGTLSSASVHPREVFKAAILNNASSIIVAHQHPSQVVAPSQADIDVTEILVEAGSILQIPVLDHLIVNAKAEFFSFKDKGYI